MKTMFHYDTVTDAIKALRAEGFNIDFNLNENYLIAGENRLTEDDFEIVDIYRYEGDSDPADEATVYAIVTKSGMKGVLVTGYGNNSGDLSANILRKMHY